MAYGISCVNTSGQLTLDSDAYLLGYLGKASFVALNHATGDATLSNAGYATYGFTSPGTGPILCAMGLRSSGSSGARIEAVTRTGSNTWSIKVIDTSTTTEGYNNLYWLNLTNASIYVWGVPTSVSGYGMALYNSAGTLSADLSKIPMTFTEQVSFANNVMTATMGSYVRPAILGHTNSFHNLATNTGVGGTPWFNTQYKGTWFWNGSTTLTRGDILSSADHDDGPGPTTLGHAATSALIIETNGLP